MENFLFLAQVAHQCHRVDDAWTFTRMAVQHPACTFSAEVQEAVLLATKVKVDQTRKAVHVMRDVPVEMQEVYGSEGRTFASEVIGLVTTLLPRASFPHALPFLYKLRGDALRYLAEFGGCVVQPDVYNAYHLSNSLADTYLVATHPLRLNIALTLAVFLKQCANQPDAARRVVAHMLHQVPDGVELCQESAELVQLMKEAHGAWGNNLVVHEPPCFCQN
jgi:hypothetical protein